MQPSARENRLSASGFSLVFQPNNLRLSAAVFLQYRDVCRCNEPNSATWSAVLVDCNQNAMAGAAAQLAASSFFFVTDLVVNLLKRCPDSTNTRLSIKSG